MILLFCALSGLLFLYFKTYPKPSVNFPSLKGLPKAFGTSIPTFLFLATLCFFLLGFLDPHRYVEDKKSKATSKPTEGLAIYFVLDHSGSMQQPAANEKSHAKLDLLKSLTEKFIKERPNDLIGVVSFARTAQVLSPLTLDHKDVLDKLKGIKKVEDKDMEGTAIGYALFKTVNLIAATRAFAEEARGYTMKDALIILITDGFQDPSPLDTGHQLRNIGLIEAATYAKEKGVKLYLINVEPQIAKETFAPHRRLLERTAKLTGGNFYLAENAKTLQKVYKTIDQLEKSELPSQELQRHRISYAPYFIAIGIALLFCASLFETVFFRRIP